MYKFYLLFLLVITMSFCNQQDKKYYLKNKWRTSSGGFFRVRQAPKKITEDFYTHIDSIGQDKFPVKGSSDEYFFNTEGDIIRRHFVYNNSVSKSIYHYTPEGYTLEIEIPDFEGSTKKTSTTFELNKNGKFLEITHYDDHKKEKWYEYKRNGEEIITEEYFTTNEKQRSFVVKDHLFYNGDYLVKQVRTTGANNEMQTRTYFYYYNQYNGLDSIISLSGKVMKRHIYIKNVYGDPVAEYEIKRGDTTAHNNFSYLYDHKGNWVRRFEKQIAGPAYLPKDPNTLVIRKIEY